MSARRSHRAARRGLVALILALLLLPTAEALARPNLPDLEDEVMCVVCKRPLATSGGTAAEDERAVILNLIDQNLTKQQIKDKLVAEYGEQVLVTDDSPVAAIAPVVAAVVGIGSVGLLLRRRRAGGGGDARGGSAAAVSTGAGRMPDAAAPASASVSTDDDARIDAELAERS